jgi:hypothetical protein
MVESRDRLHQTDRHDRTECERHRCPEPLVLAQIPAPKDVLGIALVMLGVAMHKPPTPEH